MRYVVLVAVLAAFACVVCRAGPIAAETLQDALAAAYHTSPELRGEQANLRRVDEGVPQALSGWRPTVTWDTSAGVERREIDRDVELPETLTTPATTERRSNTDHPNPVDTSLLVTQPLYRGGRTVAATAAAEADVQAGRQTLIAAEQNVFLDVVTIYMNVLRDTAEVQLNRNNVKVLERQLEAANDRFNVGEVTRTDVAQAEARLAGAISELVSAQGNLAQSRATYGRVVGKAPGFLEPPPPLPELPATEQVAIEIALAENPALIAATFQETASRHNIRVASGELLPVVTLEGELAYLDANNDENLERQLARITARISVPLYQSGFFYSNVRASRQINNQRRVLVEDTRRRVREATIQAWEELQTQRSQIISNREQVRANEIALEGVIQEAQVGSRTTLDVLDAEQELLDAQVDLVRSERDEYVAAFALQASIGRLTVENLNLPVERYDPTAYYRRVRNKWFGTDGGLD